MNPIYQITQITFEDTTNPLRYTKRQIFIFHQQYSFNPTQYSERVNKIYNGSKHLRMGNSFRKMGSECSCFNYLINLANIHRKMDFSN